ncbi:hypothetical protein [Pseudohoeflea coraliihabitans]|uniref:Porin n=1 Tax=Pseudohoeflea coraliihabitans TaxID=2860393 RepID=A0ABS6WR26_9HYPH|nr:hypothetical protein [Pseudohoeflea sp. DP4N28-3]MBW3098103.1 hypothetical protein [Pseudohoeflea sp. DP4N28-3]
MRNPIKITGNIAIQFLTSQSDCVGGFPARGRVNATGSSTVKSILIGLSAAALSSAAYAADISYEAPVMVEPANTCSGHIEAYLGGVNINAFGTDETFFSYGGAARAHCRFSERWNVQGDLFVDIITDDGDDLTGVGGAFHVFWRDPSAYAVGVFATIEGVDLVSDDITSYTVGPEAQLYLGNITLYGQAFFGQADYGGPDADIWGVRGEVRYFATENLRFDAELGYRTADFGPGSLDTFIAATEVAYRFDGTPFSLFGRYQFDHTSVSGGGPEFDTHKFTAGVRVTFGAGTLLDEDRNGATMDTFRSVLQAF